VHDVLPHYPAAWSPLIFRFFYRSFDLLVAHGNVAKVQLRQLGINTPLTVVPHGVYDIYRTVGMSRSEARTHFHDLKSDDFVVLFFGHVDERKGIDELLRCWQNQGIDKGLKLIIAGQCAITDTQVLQRYQSAQSDPRFIVINRRVPFEDVEPLFEACDAVVLPYLEGTTSGVLKLAMAFAKPVIATDIGDLPETVPAEAGVIISHKSVLADLPHALARLRKHYPSYQANWRTVSAGYGWPAIAAHCYEFLTDGIDNSAERINASTSILE